MNLYCRYLCIIIQFEIIESSFQQTHLDFILILTTGSNTVIQITVIPIIKPQSLERCDCPAVFEGVIPASWVFPEWHAILDMEQKVEYRSQEKHWAINCWRSRWACTSLLPVHHLLLNVALHWKCPNWMSSLHHNNETRDYEVTNCKSNMFTSGWLYGGEGDAATWVGSELSFWLVDCKRLIW